MGRQQQQWCHLRTRGPIHGGGQRAAPYPGRGSCRAAAVAGPHRRLARLLAGKRQAILAASQWAPVPLHGTNTVAVPAACIQGQELQ